MRPEVLIAPAPREAAEAAASLWGGIAARALSRHGKFLVALSGGTSPLPLYALLAERACVSWHATHVFWGDERCVPPEHPDSNFGAAREVLLSRVPVPDAQVHRIRGENPPGAETARYERLLRDLVPGEPPRLDLVLLGMGADGHVASLFPGGDALQERGRLVHAVEPPDWGEHRRITLTLPAINAAHNVLFLVTGVGKAATAAQVLERRRTDAPASCVHLGAGDVFWVLDDGAASELSDRVRRAGQQAWASRTGPEE